MTVTCRLVTSGYASTGVARYARTPYAAVASVTTRTGSRRRTQKWIRGRSTRTLEPSEKSIRRAVEQERAAHDDPVAWRHAGDHLHASLDRWPDDDRSPLEGGRTLLDIDDRVLPLHEDRFRRQREGPAGSSQGQVHPSIHPGAQPSAARRDSDPDGGRAQSARHDGADRRDPPVERPFDRWQLDPRGRAVLDQRQVPFEHVGDDPELGRIANLHQRVPTTLHGHALGGLSRDDRASHRGAHDDRRPQSRADEHRASLRALQLRLEPRHPGFRSELLALDADALFEHAALPVEPGTRLAERGRR